MQDSAYDILMVFSLGILGGMLGGGVCRLLHVPQVVGYIIAGLLLGESGWGLIRQEDIGTFQPFNFFALGVIGMLVGAELKFESFRKYGKQYLTLLLGEGLTTFVLVGSATFLCLYSLNHDMSVALAGGAVLGAIAAATDPASTMDVIWEYRALGTLSASIIAIVALDDALALALYGLGTSVAASVTTSISGMTSNLAEVAVELAGSIVLGGAFGLLANAILRRLPGEEQSFAFIIGLILLAVTLGLHSGLDVILMTMAMGLVLVNVAPNRSREPLEGLHRAAAPIYTLFFVLVGCRLHWGHMPTWLWTLVFAYVFARIAGKVLGCYLGGTVCGLQSSVRRHLGIGLLAQGGVAIGLSITASHYLSHVPVAAQLSLGDAVVFAVTASTLFAQLIGPAMVKLAIHRVGENGRNVAREDIIASWSAADVMSTDFAEISQDEPIAEVLREFTEHEHVVFPVTDEQHRLVGILSLVMLKNIITQQHLWHTLTAGDVMRRVLFFVEPSVPLEDVLDHLRRFSYQYAVVIEDRQSLRPIGIVDVDEVEHAINREILRRRKAKPISEAGASGCSPYTEEVVPC